MKDGKKAKSQKAPSKKSGKAAVAKKAAPSPVRSSKGGEKKAVKKVSPIPSPGSKGSAAKTAAPRAADGWNGEVQFNNPAVAAAFKRAVKKYPAALKRLTD